MVNLESAIPITEQDCVYNTHYDEVYNEDGVYKSSYFVSCDIMMLADVIS